MFFQRLQYNNRVPSVPLTQEQLGAIQSFGHKLNSGYFQFENVPCLCGNRNGKLIAKRDRYGFDVPTYLCRNCGIMWTNPRMTEESLIKFYEIEYRQIYSGEDRESFFKRQVIHGEFIFNYANKINISCKNKKVFDVGCGMGGTLIPFLKAGWSGFGCDLDDDYLSYGKSLGLTLCNGNANILSQYGKADLLILSHVLEHIPNPRKMIIQFHDLLNDAGYIYIELPGIFNIHRAYGDILNFMQNAHLYHFTLATLKYVMSKYGFRLIKGDEHIHAVFQKIANDITEVSLNNKYQYWKILFYLIAIAELCYSLRKAPLIKEVFPILSKMKRLIIQNYK